MNFHRDHFILSLIKEMEELMQQINSYFELNTIKNNTLKTLYNHYFNDYTKQAEFYFI